MKIAKHFILALVLLMGSFLLPVFGELIRVKTIGEERQCCMIFDTPQEMQKLEKRLTYAREQRGLANAYMISGMVLGALSAITAAVVFYRGLKQTELKSRLKLTLGVVFGLILVVALFWTFGNLCYFLIHLERYYELGGFGHLFLNFMIE